MTKNNCFVFLNKTSNRVCKKCQCYSHPSCWGKYIKSKRNYRINSDIFSTEIFLSSYKVKCPQCRAKIRIKKSITRSDTEEARWYFIIKNLRTYVNLIDSIDDFELKKNKIRKMFIFIKKNKLLLRKRQFLKYFRRKLKLLYFEDNWGTANEYYFNIFGTQIIN